MQRLRPGAETTKVEARMATYSWFVLLQIINGRLLTGQLLIMTGVEITSGKDHTYLSTPEFQCKSMHLATVAALAVGICDTQLSLVTVVRTCLLMCDKSCCVQIMTN